MDKRLHKAKRIVGVQSQLHRSAEWKLAEIVRARTELEATQARLIEALNHDLFGPLQLECVSRRLTRLAEEAARIGAAETAQAVRVRDEALALKRAERLADTASRHAAVEAERVQTRDIVEAAALAPRRDASLA